MLFCDETGDLLTTALLDRSGLQAILEPVLMVVSTHFVKMPMHKRNTISHLAIQHANLYKNSIFLSCSYQVCRYMNSIRMCMETGRTVILLNLSHLYESLYDAFNQVGIKTKILCVMVCFFLPFPQTYLCFHLFISTTLVLEMLDLWTWALEHTSTSAVYMITSSKFQSPANS